jgi:hypothetical protein
VKGALMIGDPEYVAEKILHVDKALGGITRLNFQMTVATVPHAQMLQSIELLGSKLAPIIRRNVGIPLREMQGG